MRETQKIGLFECGYSRAFSRAVFCLALFLCAFVPVRSLLEYWLGSWVKAIPDLCILSLFFWFLFEKRFRIRLRVQDVCFLAFLLVAFVNTVLVKKVGLLPYVFQVRSIGLYYILYFVFRHLSASPRVLRAVLRTLQGVSLLLFALALVEKITSKMLLFPPEWADRILYPVNFTRVYSLLNNPNTYGLFLVLVFVFSLWCLIHEKIATHPLFYVTLISALFLTMSRSALIACGIAAAAALGYCLWRERARFDWIGLCRALLVILPLSFFLYRGVLFGSALFLEDAMEENPELQSSIAAGAVNIEAEDRLNHTLTDKEIQQSSVDGRVYTVTKGLEIFLDHPLFGTGFGTYGSSAALNYPSPLSEEYGFPKDLYSDNEYITIVVENGIFGTLLFAGFLGGVLWDVRKNFAKLSVCLLVAWFGVFYNIFEVQIGACLFWLFLALPVGRSPASGEAERKR